MKVAILSDCHDNIWNLEKALGLAQGIGAAICCGDLCSPFTLARLVKGVTGPVHVVRGNNDGDLHLMLRIVSENSNLTLYPTPLGEFELEGRRVAITHFPTIAVPLSLSGRYDLVCCGRSHRREIVRVDQTLRLNPGDVMGLFGEPCFAIYDTERGEAEFVDL